jgi:hypothetical protein
LDFAVKAAGGIDHDHGIFGGTLPDERSPLRGNRFPEPNAYRQDRELAEQAHALASQVGLRQAAHQLGIHRSALKAAFQQWGFPPLERRVGWQPSRFLADRAEAERAFQLAERLGSVNAAAAKLVPPGRRCAKPSPATAWHARSKPPGRPPARRRGRPQAQRPATPSLDPVFVALNHDELEPVPAHCTAETLGVNAL